MASGFKVRTQFSVFDSLSSFCDNLSRKTKQKWHSNPVSLETLIIWILSGEYFWRSVVWCKQRVGGLSTEDQMFVSKKTDCFPVLTACWNFCKTAIEVEANGELSSFQKFGSCSVLGPNVSFCPLCLTVACDSCIMFYLRKTISTSSRVFCLVHLCFWMFELLLSIKEPGSDYFLLFLSSRGTFRAWCGMGPRKFWIGLIFHQMSMYLRIPVWTFRLLGVLIRMFFPQWPRTDA